MLGSIMSRFVAIEETPGGAGRDRFVANPHSGLTSRSFYSEQLSIFIVIRSLGIYGFYVTSSLYRSVNSFRTIHLAYRMESKDTQNANLARKSDRRAINVAQNWQLLNFFFFSDLSARPPQVWRLLGISWGAR